jgi:hypothetical protein
MATIKQPVSARTALAASGLAALASATYAASSAYSTTANQPMDVVVEVEAATTNTPAGNKQLVVFLQESLDGSNFRSGPTSGTSTTDEANLRWLGTIPVGSSGVTERGMFSVVQALGFVPPAFRLVFKNDLGVALTSAAAYTAEVSNTVA